MTLVTKKEIRKNCQATIKVNFRKYFDNEKVRIFECCLFTPHPKYYHYNPCLRLTCGGHTAKVRGWRAWIAKKGEPNYKAI